LKNEAEKNSNLKSGGERVINNEKNIVQSGEKSITSSVPEEANIETSIINPSCWESTTEKIKQEEKKAQKIHEHNKVFPKNSSKNNKFDESEILDEDLIISNFAYLNKT